MKVSERDTRDPLGRTVDVYRLVRYVYSICFESSSPIANEEMRELVWRAFSEIGSGNRQLRERDLPVFFGRISGPSENTIYTIGLPERTQIEACHALQEVARSRGRIVDLGRAVPRDIGARPFGRYLHGSSIFYADPFAEQPADRRWEWRSYEIVAVPNRSPRSPLPAIDVEAGRIHDPTSWARLMPAILEMVEEMTGAASYRSLRSAMKGSFGIEVREVESPDFPHYGILSPGWLSERGCEVTVLLRASLPVELKYVVLAHELAHFTRHFLLIYLNQFVEQASWTAPELETSYLDLIDEKVGNLSRLEEDANVLSSYLLIPPRYDLEAMASMISERGRPLSDAELAWRFLQSLFPEGALNEGSWRELDDTRERLVGDLAVPDDLNSASADTLYLAMLRAVLGRDEYMAGTEIESVNKDLSQLTEAIGDVLQDAYGSKGLERSRLRRGDRAARSTISAELSSLRRSLPPLDAEGQAAPERLPLAPTSGNRSGKADGRWRSPLAPEHHAKTVADWQAEFPFHAVILYPFQKPVSKDFEWPTRLD